MRIYELPYGFEKYFEFRIIKNDLFLKRYLYFNIIDSSLILNKMTGLDLSIYKKEFNFNYLKLNRQESLLLNVPHDKKVNLYFIYTVTPPTDMANLINSFVLKERDYKSNLRGFTNLRFRNKPHVNILKTS